MSRRTKNRGILEVLKEGPEYKYGSESDEERQCVGAAKSILIEAKEPVEYRIKLLEELLSFTRRVESDSACNDGSI
jgi:hypothetical protein